MDNEIKDMLIKLLEGQTMLETQISGVKNDIRNNSIKLEAIEKKIDIIAEVQTSHKEQNEKSFKNTDSVIEDKTSLIEISVKNISKDVKEVKESIEVLKDMTGRHEVDINILKRRPV
ncbi:hypothetical protein CLHOM_02300 [Clostridium homopropionicum DSM 5847]|uniref:Uncharacterized protein n=1 Tax=Clostridium homopropionicum DSM 5847 TaxID=1121318 RepID=A0A0L6ZEE9_9CLOT|nr:hypothetical protein [Clostridium homopropionicum]KOA21345.1 hypothetical protein CLHOM_02300 [Clostridium homopropionicum DSM 5847]SFG98043.1 hypothetical protein SAMN04488501_1308 [Clostridium homopropionicum]